MRVRDLLDLYAPRRCLSCGGTGVAPICRACSDSTPWRDPADDAAPPGASELAACRTLLWLEGPAVAWLHSFKYPAPGWTGLDGPASSLVSWLAGRLGESLDPGPRDLVVAIPLHTHRLRARGFNPALYIARSAFARWCTPVSGRVLRRIRNTPTQTGLDRALRRANVDGAFDCRPGPVWPPDCVWLVDDVVTTGATLSAAARVLRESGVSRVVGVGLARTRAGGDALRAHSSSLEARFEETAPQS